MNRNEKIPEYFNKLNSDDQKEYFKLRDYIRNNFRRKNINDCLEIILSKIKTFVFKNETDKNTRMLVCGVAWIRNGLGIYSTQLSILISISKSLLNKGFTSNGYLTTKMDDEQAADLMKLFPAQMSNCKESRNWTIRCQKLKNQRNENNNTKMPLEKMINSSHEKLLNEQTDFFFSNSTEYESKEKSEEINNNLISSNKKNEFSESDSYELSDYNLEYLDDNSF